MKKKKKQMTADQLAKAVSELNSDRLPKLRGGRAGQIHKNKKRYSRKEGKRVELY